MLLVLPFIQHVMRVCPHADSSEHIPWSSHFFVFNSSHITAFSGINGDWHMGAFNLSPRVDTHPLSLCNPWVFTHSLPFHSARVFTHPLHLCSPRVNTRLLWGGCMLATRYLIPFCASRCWALQGMFRSTTSFTIHLWGSLLLMSCWLGPSLL